MEGAEDNREKLDLLRKFTKIQSECRNESNKREEEEEGEDEDMELSLGLSMNGRFGVDPARNKKLKRSSSVANTVLVAETGAGPTTPLAAGLEADVTLPRTRSLPAEAEEEWRRRRKGLQSVRRMEARKKRMEKLKNLRLPRDKMELSRDGNGGRNGPYECVNGDLLHGQRLGDGIHRRFENGEVVESSSQGFIEPLWRGSSCSHDLIEETGQKQNTEVSPSSWQSPNGLEPTGLAFEREAKGATGHRLKNTMPYVTTKETGPDGRRVEGFLYGYKKGQDVRIICACHGTLFTPKEFIEHGGARGVEVEHPLKHIVVNPFPLS